MLDAELLLRVLRSGAIGVPKSKKNTVGIGSTVLLDNSKTYFIAGDWTPHAGQFHGGAVVVSCNAPIAKQLLGKKSGEAVTIGRSTATIKSISVRH